MYGKRSEGMLSDFCETECGFGDGQEFQDFTQYVKSRQTKDGVGMMMGCQNREQVMQGSTMKEYCNFEKAQRENMDQTQDMWQGVDKSRNRQKRIVSSPK